VIILDFSIKLELYSSGLFPLETEKQYTFQGGKIIIDTTNPLRTYLVKPNWTNSLETISVWEGIEKKKSIGKILSGYEIEFISIINKKLAVVASQNDSLFLILLDSNLNHIAAVKLTEVANKFIEAKYKILNFDNYSFYLQINKNLYNCRFQSSLLTAELINSNVEDFILFAHQNIKLILLEKNALSNILILLDKNHNKLLQNNVSLGDITKLYHIDSKVIILSSFENSNSTLIEIYNLKTNKIEASKYLNCDPNQIAISPSNDTHISFSYINNENSKIYCKLLNYQGNNYFEDADAIELPDNLYEPMFLTFKNGYFILLLRNGILIYDQKMKIQLNENSGIGQNFSTKPSILLFDNYLILSSKYFSEIIQLKENYFWLLFRILSYTFKYAIPILLLVLLLIFFRLYINQKKVFQDLINLSSLGIIIFIDERGNVKNLNFKAKEFLELDTMMPLERPLRAYITNPSMKEIISFVERGMHDKQNQSKKITIIRGNNQNDYLFNISPLWSIIGRFQGIMLNGFDITEQLERQRLTHWAQLAHDMQTNLLTIRLNAEQMTCRSNPDNQNRIEKILFQVTLLQKRVRDLVTVGRSTNLEIVETSSLKLIEEVASEFDKTIFPNVIIKIKGTDFQINCDKPKLIRALRNAVENAIKALPERTGIIELETWNEAKFNYFKVKDNGKGMDEEVKKKMLTPYFSTAKDGTGFGIGTMIIQQVVELHKGKLLVSSKENVGTELIFQLPKL
jgi:signal transduction histidine kinase